MICEVGGEATYAGVMRRAFAGVARSKGGANRSSTPAKGAGGSRMDRRMNPNRAFPSRNVLSSVVPSDRGDPRARMEAGDSLRSHGITAGVALTANSDM
jgi:hypothetical protein